MLDCRSFYLVPKVSVLYSRCHPSVSRLSIYCLNFAQSSYSAVVGRSLQSDDLLNDAKQVIGGAVNAVESGLSNVVNKLFGTANTWATQIPHNIDSLCKPLLPFHAHWLCCATFRFPLLQNWVDGWMATMKFWNFGFCWSMLLVNFLAPS